MVRLHRAKAEEPPYENSHQHKAPSQWPLVALSLMVLLCVGLIALLFGQQARMADYQEQVTEYMQGKGDYRDAEMEKTREFLCAVLPQLEADDAGVLERTTTYLRCPQGPKPTAFGSETPALPTPIDSAQSNSTGDPTWGSQSDTGTGSGNDAGGNDARVGAPPARPSPVPRQVRHQEKKRRRRIPMGNLTTALTLRRGR